MSDLKKRLADACWIEGDFLLRSGKRATRYFDKYRFEADPLLLADTAKAMTALLPEKADVLAGLELGGVPIATAMSLETGLPAAFVRKEAKTYGTCNLAEGAQIEGQHLVIIEDVVSTGGAIIDSSLALRDRGARVTTALCAGLRDDAAIANLAQHGIELRPLFRLG